MEKLRVLIVEDHPAIRDLLAISLQDAGCETIPVATAKDAMYVLESDTIDLAFVDLELGPGGQGWDIIERRRRSKDPLVVVLSGSHNPADAQRAMACGAPYLLKPASASQVATVLKAAIERRDRAREGRRNDDR